MDSTSDSTSDWSVSSTSSDDDEHRNKGGTGAPEKPTDQGLVDMVFGCLLNVSDEITVNALILSHTHYFKHKNRHLTFCASSESKNRIFSCFCFNNYTKALPTFLKLFYFRTTCTSFTDVIRL